jgi:uncharacterized protein YdcH (DUF465 family)
LADLGLATRQRAGVAVRTPSNFQDQATDIISQRQAGQGERLSHDITGTIAPRTDVHAMDEDLIKARSETAGPLRDAAFNEQASLYRGGAPYRADHPGTTYLTPSKEGAESYVDMHNENVGGGGVLEQGFADIKNSAPLDVVRQAAWNVARQQGWKMDPEKYNPAMFFDHSLMPPNFVEGVTSELKRAGYDGTHLPDLAYGKEAPITAVIPFDPKVQVTIGAQRERIPEDPILQGLARLPMAQRALTHAKELAANERLLLQAQGKDVSHLADFPTPGTPMSVKTLDHLKRYLDDEINRAYAGQSSFSKAEATQLKDLRNTIRDRMKEVVPDYAKYLDTYSDASGMRDALWAGRGGPRPDGRPNPPGFDRLDPEVIAAQQAKRPQAEQELYRVGAARKLDDVVQTTNDTAQPADRLLNTPRKRDQLAATGVSPEDLNRLEQAVGQERQMGALYSELRGSKGDARAAARRDAEAGHLNQALPFNLGSKASVAAWVLRKTLGAVDLTRNAAINEALLPRFLSQDKSVIDNTIRELVAAGQQDAAAQLLRAQRARAGAKSIGRSIGAPVSTQEGDY